MLTASSDAVLSLFLSEGLSYCTRGRHSSRSGQAEERSVQGLYHNIKFGRRISGLALCGELPVACRTLCKVRDGVHRSGSRQEGRARAFAHASGLQAQARPHSLWCLAGLRSCQSRSRDAAGGCTCECTRLDLKRLDQGRPDPRDLLEIS